MRDPNLKAAILAAGIAAQSWAFQDDNSMLRLQSTTRVVEINVSVQDAGNKPVDNLKASDFTVVDNGKHQPFTIFHENRVASGPVPVPPASRQQPPPIKLPPNTFTNIGVPPPLTATHSAIILLDGINGWFDNFGLARKAVIEMLHTVPADERVALYVISKNQGLLILQDYTVDHAQLLKAIAEYVPNAMCPAPPGVETGEGMREPISAPPPPPPPDSDSAEASRAGRMAAIKAVTGPSTCVTPDREATLLRSAAESVRLSLKALAEKLAGQPGRKNIFWITQGFPSTLLRGEFETNWNRTITELNDADVAVNAVDSHGLGGPPRMWGLGEVLTMKRLAEDTGGNAYFGRNDLGDAITSGIAESRSTYTLGFYLTKIDNRFHTLKVLVDRPGVHLSYRQGYYAADEVKPDHDQKKSELSTMLLNPADSGAVGIVATLDLQSGSQAKTLNVKLRLDPGSLTLKQSRSGWSGKVEEMFVALNATGRQVGRVSAVKPFDIPPDAKAAWDASGITMVQTFPLSGEAAKLVILVRDSASGRTGSLAVPVEAITARVK